MIPITLTTTNGETKKMTLPDKDTVETFITSFSVALPVLIFFYFFLHHTY